MSFEVQVIDNTPKKKAGTAADGTAVKDLRVVNEEISYFYFEEYSRLLENASKYYRLVYLFLFETGSRIEEAREVKFKDFDIDTKKMRVRTLKQRNSKKARLLPISDKLTALILQHHLEKELKKDDFILAKSTGRKPITQQAVDQQMKRDCLLLGIDRHKAHCHAWRHSRAIQLLNSGESIVMLQKFLGHSTINSTLVYFQYSNQPSDPKKF